VSHQLNQVFSRDFTVKSKLFVEIEYKNTRDANDASPALAAVNAALGATADIEFADGGSGTDGDGTRDEMLRKHQNSHVDTRERPAPTHEGARFCVSSERLQIP
jgi:hypothetical protein